MRVTATSLVLAGALCAGMAGAQTSDPEPLAGNKGFKYPKDAPRGLTGDVTFAANVDEKGAVTGVEIRNVPLPGVGFEQAVESAVRRWRYRPATRDGKATAGIHVATVTFRLHPEDEEAIHGAVRRLAEAWSGQPDAVAALLDPEIVVGGPRSSEAATGRPAAAAWVAARRAAGATAIDPRLKRIRFLAPDLAQVELLPQPASSGPSWPALVAKMEDGWRFISLRDRGSIEGLRLAGMEIAPPRRVKKVPGPRVDPIVQRGDTGTVVLDCLIGPDGRVEDVTGVRGPKLLRQTFADTVRGWGYEPAVVEGKPVPVLLTAYMTVRTIHFEQGFRGR